MADNQDFYNGTDLGELISWLITIILLITIWPVGVFLLIRKLTGRTGTKRQQVHQPYNIRREGSAPIPGTQGTAAGRRRTPPAGASGMRPSGRQGKPISPNRGKGLFAGGIVLMVVFALALTGLPVIAMEEGFLRSLALMSPVIGLFCGGAVMTWAGAQRSKKAKRFRKYLALIGKRDSISISTLAQAMPVSIHRACEDLQDMLDDGILTTGYLDMATGRLIFGEEGLRENPIPELDLDGGEEKKDELDMNDDNAVLTEIRRVNDAIADPEMSRKIDRIGEITGKIFAYQKQNPNKSGQLRTFLSYYLPTTLKILRAYAQMEAQGIEGENIRAAKGRIEGMMDKVAEGFEKQFDRLFEGDALDITTDVEVLERMLEKDGLSGNQGLTLGG